MPTDYYKELEPINPWKLIIICIVLSLVICIAGNCQTNCPAIPICNTYSATPSGFGVQELNVINRGCLSVEHNSTWLSVTILTSGTFTFTINPNVNADDFDYGVWGPNSSCPPTSNPIRCSYAIGAGNGNTGLNTTAVDVSEGVFGDQWTQQINVTAGQTYLILVDNFTTNNGFQISFGGTSTLDCGVLPIELLNFQAKIIDLKIELTWTTLSEINNDHFLIEKYDSIYGWNPEFIVDGVGNSSIPTEYKVYDENPKPGYNYYRLKQVDENGDWEMFPPIVIYLDLNQKTIIKFIDVQGKDIENINEFKGFYMILYSDGTIEKRIKY